MMLKTAALIPSPRLRDVLSKRWKVPKPARQHPALRSGVALLTEAGRPRLGRTLELAVPQQPFDEQLLALSPLYVRSRELFVETGGKFRPAMVSSPRSLGSPTLLGSEVEYSPVESEYCWAATDSRERRNLDHLLGVRFYVTSLFHEQNHRTLWAMLKQDGLSAPRDVKSMRRFLNFAESLVIGLDMALGDELGPRLANLFYLTGATYDPGSIVRQEIGSRKSSRREYRNYLQAASFATYLNLELYDEKQVERVIMSLFPSLGKFAARASTRGTALDPAFVLSTNPLWQKKHLSQVSRILGKKGNPGLRLPDDPLDNRQYYLFAERWFGAFGL
jgi:hypothetical protein